MNNFLNYTIVRIFIVILIGYIVLFFENKLYYSRKIQEIAEKQLDTGKKILKKIFFIKKATNKNKQAKTESLMYDFKHYGIRIIIIMITLISALLQLEIIRNNADKLVLSSSLVVAMIGFCFQESVSNIVHGFVLSLSNNFHKGDRISFNADGNVITGYIKGMDMRCFFVQDIQTNCTHMIPNKMMNNMLVKNYTATNENNSYMFTVDITYESNLEKAIELLKEIINEHEEITNKECIKIFVSNLGDSGITLSAKICTKTIENNFSVCSDLRKSVLKIFKENKIDIAYPHMQIIN